MNISVFSHSVKGLRDEQQDRFIVKFHDGIITAAVADGMGGHQEGDIAASAAIELVMVSPSKVPAKDVILAAHQIVYNENHRGTTLTMCQIKGQFMYFGHVGDSRLYHIRDGVITMLTRDQSIRGVQLKNGAMTQEEFDNGEGHSGLLGCVGVHGKIYVQTGALQLNPGDALILATDGVFGSGRRGRFKEWVMKHFSRDECAGGMSTTVAEDIVNESLALGHNDNATVIVIKVNKTAEEEMKSIS